MMRKTLVLLFGPWLLASLATGCEEVTHDSQQEAPLSFPDDFESQLSAADQKKVLARVDDQVITLMDFERHLASQPPYARARFISSPERQQEFLDNLIRFEVLAAEAQRRGYHRHPEVVQAMKQTMVRKMMTGDLQDMVKLSDITEAEMRKYYEEHHDEFHKPEEVRVSQIVVASREEAEQLVARLKAEIDKDKRSYRKIFSEAAKEQSLDAESKARGGDLRFFPRNEDGGKQPEAITKAAFALEQVGSLSEPVQTEKGWHVLLLTGRKNRYDRAFEAVQRQIQNRLYRQKKRATSDAFVEKLKSSASIERHVELLARLKSSAPSAPQAPAHMQVKPVSRDEARGAGNLPAASPAKAGSPAAKASAPAAGQAGKTPAEPQDSK